VGRRGAGRVADGSAKDTLHPAKGTARACWVKALGGDRSIAKQPAKLHRAAVLGLPLQGHPRALVPQRLPAAFPSQGTSKPGAFLETSTTSWKKTAVFLGPASFSQMCQGRGKEQQSWPAGESVHLQPIARPATSLWLRVGRRGCPQAPGAAPSASEAVLVQAGDARGM